jgi:glycosyltransferase involved in cell wall biosynthesis
LARRYALWLHNPAGYMRKPRHLLPYLRFRPSTVFLGAYHRASWLNWLPLFGALEIPHGVGASFVDQPSSDAPPPPRAIFFSNPRRGLIWLVKLWVERIRPAVAGGELHVYAGHVTYGVAKDDEIAAALAFARSHAESGVILHDPLPKAALAPMVAASRAMLYRGDSGETFCLAAAEASAVGVPVVTAGVGSLGERVRDGVTGVVAPGEDDFVKAAIGVLTDDALWRAYRNGALAERAAATWAHSAELWERAFFG